MKLLFIAVLWPVFDLSGISLILLSFAPLLINQTLLLYLYDLLTFVHKYKCIRHC